MRIARVAVVALLVAAPLLAEEVDQVVLRVNDRIVTLEDYLTSRDARIDAITKAPDLSAEDRQKMIAESGQAAMRELYEEALVMSRADQLHITASPSEIDRAIDQTKHRYGLDDDQQFAQALAQSGMTLDQYRQRLARNILYDEVLQKEVRPKVKVDDEMVVRYYHEHPKEFAVPEQRHVEEAIVRSAAAEPSADERVLAAKIRDGLLDGKRVAEVVKALGAEDKVIVLDHDWIERGTLDKPLETAVWELGNDGTAGPLEGRGGLHILHVVDIRPASEKPLEDVREQVRLKLQQQQFNLHSKEFLDNLAASAYIVEHIPAAAKGYRDASIGVRDPLRELLRGDAKSGPAKKSLAGPATSAPAPTAEESGSATPPPGA